MPNERAMFDAVEARQRDPRLWTAWVCPEAGCTATLADRPGIQHYSCESRGHRPPVRVSLVMVRPGSETSHVSE